MIILGVDPGLRKTGYGLIEKHTGGYKLIAADVINLEKIPDIHDRLYHLFVELNMLLKQYKPSCVSLEKIFSGKNIRSAFVIGEARAACIISALSHGVKVYEYATRSVKQGVTGYGGAAKEDVERMVKLILNFNGKLKEDASDALALAIFHGNMSDITLKLQ